MPEQKNAAKGGDYSENKPEWDLTVEATTTLTISALQN
jgi:hypothetical protein